MLYPATSDSVLASQWSITWWSAVTLYTPRGAAGARPGPVTSWQPAIRSPAAISIIQGRFMAFSCGIHREPNPFKGNGCATRNDSAGSDEAQDCQGVGNPFGGARWARERGSRCAGDAGVRGPQHPKTKPPPAGAEGSGSGGRGADVGEHS